MMLYKNTFKLILTDLVNEPGHLNWTVRFLKILDERDIAFVSWISKKYLNGENRIGSNLTVILIKYILAALKLCTQSYFVRDKTIFVATFHNIQIPILRYLASRKNNYICQITNNLDGKKYITNLCNMPSFINFSAFEKYISDEVKENFNSHCHFIPHPKRLSVTNNRKLKNILLIFGNKLNSEDINILYQKYSNFDVYLQVGTHEYDNDHCGNKLHTIKHLTNKDYDYYLTNVEYVFVNKKYDLRISGIVHEALSADNHVLMRSCMLQRHYEQMGYFVTKFNEANDQKLQYQKPKVSSFQQAYEDANIVLSLMNAIYAINN